MSNTDDTASLSQEDFERERGERYRRLSLLTLALAEEAGEAAVGYSLVERENRAGAFERRISAMTRAIWAHRTIERLRVFGPGGARAGGGGEGRPFNPAKGALSGATPQKERAESARLSPERRPSAGFAAMDDDPDRLPSRGRADLEGSAPPAAGAGEIFAEIYARAYRGDRDAIDKVVENIRAEKAAEAGAGAPSPAPSAARAPP